MFPVLIFAAIAIPLLVIAFLAMRRSRTVGEHPVGETAADRRAQTGKRRTSQLLVIAFLAMRRSRTVGEHPVGETAADRRRTEDEFEEAERYQAEWREEHHSEVRDELLP